MSQHEEYQNSSLTWNRCAAGLEPAEGGVAEVLAALLKEEEWANATELLFGTERRQEFGELDHFGYGIFVLLMMGRYPDVLKQFVQHHTWKDKRSQMGLSIEVYPGEYLVVHEPFATVALQAMLE